MKNNDLIIEKLENLKRSIDDCIECLKSQKNTEFNFSYEEISIENKVKNFVKLIGIKPNFVGYKYIQTALLYCIDNDDVMNRGLRKKLYPIIQDKYKTTLFGVDRGIRHAILVAWKNAKEDSFFWKEFSREKAPSIAEFLILAKDNIVEN